MIGEDSFSGYTNFRHWKEQLYRTRKGNFFLYGKGGPSSRYAVLEEVDGPMGKKSYRIAKMKQKRGWKSI